MHSTYAPPVHCNSDTGDSVVWCLCMVCALMGAVMFLMYCTKCTRNCEVDYDCCFAPCVCCWCDPLSVSAYGES